MHNLKYITINTLISIIKNTSTSTFTFSVLFNTTLYTTYSTILIIIDSIYKYDNITLDKILSRHDNEALTNIVASSAILKVSISK